MTDKERYKKMRSEERFILTMMVWELKKAEPGTTVEEFLKKSTYYKEYTQKSLKADKLFERIKKREDEELIKRYKKIAKEYFGQEEDNDE